MNTVTVILTTLDSDSTIVKSDSLITDPTGVFSFNDLDTSANHTYVISAEMPADSTSVGVSVYDLLILSRFLTNQSTLSPYMEIAADYNQNGSVSVTDMIQLRAYILSVDKSLKPRWQFLPENLDESLLNVTDLKTPVQDIKLIGVKIGDLNGTACPKE